MTDIEAAVCDLAGAIDRLAAVVQELADVQRETFNATLCPPGQKLLAQEQAQKMGSGG